MSAAMDDFKKRTAKKGRNQLVGISVQIPKFVDEILTERARQRFTSRNAIARELLVQHLESQGVIRS